MGHFNILIDTIQYYMYILYVLAIINMDDLLFGVVSGFGSCSVDLAGLFKSLAFLVGEDQMSSIFFCCTGDIISEPCNTHLFTFLTPACIFRFSAQQAQVSFLENLCFIFFLTQILHVNNWQSSSINYSELLHTKCYIEKRQKLFELMYVKHYIYIL